MLKNKFRELERLLLAEIKAYYGSRLVSVVVFGSVARGTQTFDSDLDLLIIAKRLPKGRMRRIGQFVAIENKINSFLEVLQKKEGINTYLSVIIKTPEEAEKGSPLFLDMIEDAKILFDKDSFFEKVLNKLRNRLRELGAKRIWRGNAWYWDLKPDYRPGEIFEIF